MAIVQTGYQQGFGIPFERIARNNVLTDGSSAAQLASYINMLAARRFHVIAQGGAAIATGFGGGGGFTAGLNIQGHTSPNCGGLEVLMVFAPSNATTTFGTYQWEVTDVDLATTYSQAIRYLGSSGASIGGPNDIIVDRQRFKTNSGDDVAGDHDFRFICDGAGYLIYYVIYEVPRATLDTSSHTAVPLDVFHVGAPILDRDLATMTDALWKIYRRQGPAHFAWSDVTGTPPTQTGTTYKNVLDGTTTHYGANAAGFYTIPYRKNRLLGSTVDVILWATGSVNTGSGGRVQFSNSAGVIGTITGFTTSRTTRTTTATLDATLSSSDLVIVEHSDSGGNTMTTYGAGIYDYLA